MRATHCTLSRNWPIWLALLGMACACRSAPAPPAVDRHDPGAVLRAYFAAWANNDLKLQTSYMTANYTNLIFEPVESLRVLTIKPRDTSSPGVRIYDVSFEIKDAGPGQSIPSGQHTWTYTLIWNKERDSLLISNYVAG